MVDYPDRPFTVSQPAGSSVFGTPSVGASDIPRAQVPQFYADFLNKPTALNNGQTLNRYWMEDSFGKYGVELVPYGPYRMAEPSYQYHISRFNDINADCPENPPCGDANGNTYFNAVRDLWNANVPAAERATFDNAYYVSAGHDESATWQEFGEMRFVDQNAVTDAFGPKHINPAFPRNWALTRYVPWTSWAAANNIWPSASGTVSTEAESSGMGVFAHELSHNLSLPGQLRQPVREPDLALGRRHVGHDEPRLVQRPGRPAHPLAGAADAGRLARRAARHAPQAEARVRHQHRRAAAQP